MSDINQECLETDMPERLFARLKARRLQLSIDWSLEDEKEGDKECLWIAVMLDETGELDETYAQTQVSGLSVDYVRKEIRRVVLAVLTQIHVYKIEQAHLVTIKSYLYDFLPAHLVYRIYELDLEWPSVYRRYLRNREITAAIRKNAEDRDLDNRKAQQNDEGGVDHYLELKMIFAFHTPHCYAELQDITDFFASRFEYSIADRNNQLADVRETNPLYDNPKLAEFAAGLEDVDLKALGDLISYAHSRQDQKPEVPQKDPQEQVRFRRKMEETFSKWDSKLQAFVDKDRSLTSVRLVEASMTNYLANLMQSESRLRKYARDMHKKYMVITTYPSKLGLAKMNSYHPLYPYFRLTHMPISEMKNSTLFAGMEQLKQLKYITVTASYVEDNKIIVVGGDEEDVCRVRERVMDYLAKKFKARDEKFVFQQDEIMERLVAALDFFAMKRKGGQERRDRINRLESTEDNPCTGQMKNWLSDIRDSLTPDPIFTSVCDYYISGRHSGSMGNSDAMIAWCRFRQAVVRKVLVDILYPRFERDLTQTLLTESLRKVATEAALEFDKLIACEPFPARKLVASSREAYRKVHEAYNNQGSYYDSWKEEGTEDMYGGWGVEDNQEPENIRLSRETKEYEIDFLNVRSQDLLAKIGHRRMNKCSVVVLTLSDDDESLPSRCQFTQLRINGLLSETFHVDFENQEDFLEDKTSFVARQFRDLLNTWPGAVLILPTSPFCITLRNRVRAFMDDHYYNLETRKEAEECERFFRPYLGFVDPRVPIMMAHGQRFWATSENHDYLVKLGVSAGRFFQDRLSESARLWIDHSFQDPERKKNLFLYLPLHDLQVLVPLVTLENVLRSRFMAAVAAVGLETNHTIEHLHYQATLQFLPGFGPLRAAQFFQLHDSVLTAKIELHNRASLPENSPFLHKSVFQNSYPFIRIMKMTNFQTRDILNFNEQDNDPAENLSCEITRIPPCYFPLVELLFLSRFREETAQQMHRLVDDVAAHDVFNIVIRSDYQYELRDVIQKDQVELEQFVVDCLSDEMFGTGCRSTSRRRRERRDHQNMFDGMEERWGRVHMGSEFDVCHDFHDKNCGVTKESLLRWVRDFVIEEFLEPWNINFEHPWTPFKGAPLFKALYPYWNQEDFYIGKTVDAVIIRDVPDWSVKQLTVRILGYDIKSTIFRKHRVNTTEYPVNSDKEVWNVDDPLRVRIMALVSKSDDADASYQALCPLMQDESGNSTEEFVFTLKLSLHDLDSIDSVMPVSVYFNWPDFKEFMTNCIRIHWHQEDLSYSYLYRSELDVKAEDRLVKIPEHNRVDDTHFLDIHLGNLYWSNTLSFTPREGVERGMAFNRVDAYDVMTNEWVAVKTTPDPMYTFANRTTYYLRTQSIDSYQPLGPLREVLRQEEFLKNTLYGTIQPMSASRPNTIIQHPAYRVMDLNTAYDELAKSGVGHFFFIPDETNVDWIVCVLKIRNALKEYREVENSSRLFRRVPVKRTLNESQKMVYVCPDCEFREFGDLHEFTAFYVERFIRMLTEIVNNARFLNLSTKDVDDNLRKQVETATQAGEMAYVRWNLTWDIRRPGDLAIVWISGGTEAHIRYDPVAIVPPGFSLWGQTDKQKDVKGLILKWKEGFKRRPMLKSQYFYKLKQDEQSYEALRLPAHRPQPEV